MKSHYIIPFFLSNQGCKFQCVFCSQKKITKQEELNIPQKVEKYLSTIPKKQKIEVAFYGGTFTGLPISYQAQLLNEISPFIKSKKIWGIRISTRPDQMSEAQAELLKKYKVKVVELGVQSFDDKVLKLAERGHGVKELINAVKILKKNKFCIGFQMMIGLPGENIVKLKNDIKMLVKLKPDFIRLNPTLVLKDSKLEKLYLNKKYEPLSLKKAINRCLLFLLKMEEAKIKIIRLGLYPSEELRDLGVVVAGPYHPAFRDLVEGEKFYRNIVTFLGKSFYLDKTLIIKANYSDFSYILGQNKINVKRLISRYKFKNIELLKSANLKRGKIKIKLAIKEILYG